MSLGGRPTAAAAAAAATTGMSEGRRTCGSSTCYRASLKPRLHLGRSTALWCDHCRARFTLLLSTFSRASAPDVAQCVVCRCCAVRLQWASQSTRSFSRRWCGLFCAACGRCFMEGCARACAGRPLLLLLSSALLRGIFLVKVARKAHGACVNHASLSES